MAGRKLRSSAGLSQLEALCVAGILLLTAAALGLLCAVPAEQARRSLDSAALDSARELALWDTVSENNAQGLYNPAEMTYTYYYKENAGELGAAISATPDIRGRSLQNRRKTIVVIVSAGGGIVSAGWTGVPET